MKSGLEDSGALAMKSAAFCASRMMLLSNNGAAVLVSIAKKN
jgi:hypothetical protein